MNHFFALVRLLMQFVYYLLYQPLAWSYDAVAALVSAGQWRSWVLSTLDDLHGPRVLELGHGPGHLQVAMHGCRLDSVGIDRSRQMGRQAARRLRQRHLPVTLARADAQRLPFANASFEQVVSTFPSEYVIDPQTLQEVRRVLRPGGDWHILLAAYPGGKGVWPVLARRLLRLDGQAALPFPNERLAPLKTLFAVHGFQLHSEYRPVGRSLTWRLVATLPLRST